METFNFILAIFWAIWTCAIAIVTVYLKVVYPDREIEMGRGSVAAWFALTIYLSSVY